jgi:hypothetical protein
MEVPVRQDVDAGMCFPVDDVTAPLMSYELHIPEGNATVKVATGVISPIDPTKTPRIHSIAIPLGYVALDIEGDDGEKTLGEAEKTFICWKKRYIIIPGAPPPQPNPRCG